MSIQIDPRTGLLAFCQPPDRPARPVELEREICAGRRRAGAGVEPAERLDLVVILAEARRGWALAHEEDRAWCCAREDIFDVVIALGSGPARPQECLAVFIAQIVEEQGQLVMLLRDDGGRREPLRKLADRLPEGTPGHRPAV